MKKEEIILFVFVGLITILIPTILYLLKREEKINEEEEKKAWMEKIKNKNKIN